MEILDTDGDGQKEILHTDASGRIRIRDAAGELIHQPDSPLDVFQFSLCQWPTAADRKRILTWPRQGKKLWMIGLDGKVEAELPAPRSVRVFGGWCTTVQFRQHGPVFLAVLLRLKPQWNRSILYVYDDQGAIVFQEILGETGRALTVLGGKTPGSQRLLVGGEGKVWEYRQASTG